MGIDWPSDFSPYFVYLKNAALRSCIPLRILFLSHTHSRAEWNSKENAFYSIYLAIYYSEKRIKHPLSL